VITFLFLLAGLLAAHHPMLFSGFARTQGGLADSRLVNYILEHEYRWLMGYPAHAEFWSPPVFHPGKNTLAYSETLLGAAPIYWVFRMFRLPPDTAFQFWLLALSVLNYAAGWLLLRRGAGFLGFPSSLGAFLFAFANARIAHIGHPQLLPAFYPAIALLALCRLMVPAAKAGGRLKSLVWSSLLVGSISAQFYTCIYTAWFLVFGLGVAAIAAGLIRESRSAIVTALRIHAPSLALGSLVAGLILLPMAHHYLQAASEVGMREFDRTLPMLPRVQSWIYMGPGNWLYGWMSGVPPFRSMMAPFSYEQALGFGFVTLACAGAGFFLRRSSPFYRGLLFASLALVLVTTLWPGDLSLWRPVHEIVPGASALRAVARIGNLLIFPMAVGAASFSQWAQDKGPMAWIACFACVLEQGGTTEAYGKGQAREEVAEVARSVDPRSSSFLYSVLQPGVPDWAGSVPVKYHVDSMWAQLELGIPTINGYSGHSPPGWTFKAAIVSRTPAEHVRLSELLREWLARHGIDPARVCWTTADFRP
jgi:hypothetical protein